MKITSINSDLYQITAIKPQVKNSNRVNVFIDGKYSFSLDIAQLADLRPKVGQELTPSQLDNLKHASNFGKLYQRTLEWVLTRPRSIQETRNYLRRKQFEKNRPKPPQVNSEELSTEILERLISKGYLDDEKFAKFWVENRFAKKGISKKRMELELRKKGISSQIITQVLAETSRTDDAEIAKIIAKKRAKYAANPQKLIALLTRQGFDYESAKTAVQQTDSQNSA